MPASPIPTPPPAVDALVPYRLVPTPELARPAAGPSFSPAASATTARAAPTVETPPRFIYQPTPPYPRLARERGWQGTVTLEVELLADGTVGNVTVARSSGYPLLDDVAQQAVKQWRHVPAMQNGVAVTRKALLPVRFTLE